MDSIDPKESKALINAEELFRQHALQGTSLADLAIEALKPYLDDLPEKSRGFALGNTTSKGGNYNGSIRTTGNFYSKGITVVDKLTVAGNTTANELLVVRKNSTVAGNLKLKSNTVFAGKTRLAGTVTIDENVMSSRSLTLAGTHTMISTQINHNY